MKRLLSLLAVLALGVGLAACGDDDDDPTVGGDDAAETTTSSAATESTESTDSTEDSSSGDETMPAGSATVAVGQSDFGDILVTGDGMTLYLFTQDPAGGDSACTEGCADAWPALLADGAAVAGDGVDAALLGTAPHPDGEQVTYNGHRLYTYANDAAAGDVNGQAVGDVWYVVSPSGDAIS